MANLSTDRNRPSAIARATSSSRSTRSSSKKRKDRESWGRIRKLPSGRHQASYQGPDLRVYKAASTFEAIDDAREWLRSERRLIDAGTWVPPQLRNRHDIRPTLAAYAGPWLAERKVRPSTRQLYRKHLDNHVLPELGELPLDQITPVTIRRWHADLDTGPTAKAQAYSLVRTILNTAISDGVISDNPCKIVGAGSTKRKRKIKPATLGELQALIKALPDRYGAMVLLGAWCALRFGEVTELRRSDVDLKAGVISVRRGVTRVKDDHDGQFYDEIGDPKSEAGIRDVAIPPHITAMLQSHIDKWADHWFKCPTCRPETVNEHARDGLLFPAPIIGGHLQHGTFYKTWDAARKKAGRPDLRFHDLRHTSMTMAAMSGATLAELMARAGHSTPAAAMLYQHAVSSRDAEIAALLSKLATGE